MIDTSVWISTGAAAVSAIGAMISGYFAWRTKRQVPVPDIKAEMISIPPSGVEAGKEFGDHHHDEPIKAIAVIKITNVGLGTAFDVKARVTEDGFAPYCQIDSVDTPRLENGDSFTLNVPVMCLYGSVPTWSTGQWFGTIGTDRVRIYVTWRQLSDQPKIHRLPEDLSSVTILSGPKRERISKSEHMG